MALYVSSTLERGGKWEVGLKQFVSGMQGMHRFIAGILKQHMDCIQI